MRTIGGALPAMEGLRGGLPASDCVRGTISVIGSSDGMGVFERQRVNSAAQFKYAGRTSDFTGIMDGIRAIVNEHGGFNAEGNMVGIAYVHDCECAQPLLQTLCEVSERSAEAFRFNGFHR